MFEVYAEKEIFERIVLYNERNPNWYNIFCNHSQVCLNMTEEELAEEEVEDTIIFQFIKANGSKSLLALPDYFESIYDDNSVIAKKPRSAFFLNLPEDHTTRLQNAYGVLVVGNDEIDDVILSGTNYRYIANNRLFEHNSAKGWKNLLNFSLPPSNAIVINDPYFFNNTEGNGINVGYSNLIQIADALLPRDLIIPYHIAVFTNDCPPFSRIAKPPEWCANLVNDLKVAITQLRNYPVILEFVFAKTPRYRRLFLNYSSMLCEHGFAIFRTDNTMLSREENDFRFEGIFNRLEHHEGDSEFKAATEMIQNLKKIAYSSKQYISNRGQSANNRILGDCNTDLTLKNRLINDV
jgi:hypothetical protein